MKPFEIYLSYPYPLFHRTAAGVIYQLGADSTRLGDSVHSAHHYPFWNSRESERGRGGLSNGRKVGIHGARLVRRNGVPRGAVSSPIKSFLRAVPLEGIVNALRRRFIEWKELLSGKSGLENGPTGIEYR